MWVKEHCRDALQVAWEMEADPRRMNIGQLGFDRSALEKRVAAQFPEVYVLDGARLRVA